MTSIDISKLPLWVQERDTVLEYSHHVQWRNGKKPDYTRSNENLTRQSICNHPANSLETLVQNLVRTFDIEANFKTNPQQWLSVVQDQFYMATNNGTHYNLNDLIASGTYKLLIGNTEHYQASEENFETSVNLFHTAFPDGFLWEVIEVYSTPPTINFKWRHWGYFKGNYKDYLPTNQMIEIIGMTVVQVTDNFKILSLEHYYDNTKFLEELTSGRKLPDIPVKTTITEETPNPSSIKQKICGVLKGILGRGKKQQDNNVTASRCPFANLVR
ncbi:SnoaL-like polyketide cyclase [Cronbergia sp. UHCC 0137]|uniref:SnoaL-like polyketide cyclase n=1 Tax=Cronbergia sp. UHCC 0137 TaxID=3110239 RepID=UPI002B1F716B|nr:SnoaL-like polyketide cyclase [Cronbergia sp. UHCC 0137]MEA5618467.1 SnoaL-like polyketide cyclase [Cronbergia sp. UHCC 0137]